MLVGNDDDDQNNETLYQVALPRVPMNTAVYAPRKRIYAGIAIYAYACCCNICPGRHMPGAIYASPGLVRALICRCGQG